MARSKRAESEPEQSLLSEVSAEEQGLKTALEQTRAEAAGIVGDAEREATARLGAARAAIPASRERRRREILDRIAAEAETARRPPGSVEREIAEAAAPRIEEAVRLVVSAVLPGVPS